jgi:hypothetical protein
MANQGIYTNTNWIHGLVFKDTSGAPLALTGTYQCDVIRRGFTLPIFSFTEAAGTIDGSNKNVGKIILTATPAQHQPYVLAGRYRLHLRRVDAGSIWAAEGEILVGNPGDQETYVLFENASDGSTATSYAVALTGPKGDTGDAGGAINSLSELKASPSTNPTLFDGSQWKQVTWVSVSGIGAVDTAEGYVARSTFDTTKAWVRQIEGVLEAKWFGCLGESKIDMATGGFVPTRTNEGVPLKIAILVANLLDCKLTLDGSRVYIFDPFAQGSYGCWIPLYNGQSCVIDGQGCVFKNKDNTLGTHNLTIHQIYWIIRNNAATGNVSNSRAKLLDVRNITTDGNWRTLPAPGGNPAYWVSGTPYVVGDIVQIREAADETSINRAANNGPFSVVRCITANSDTILDWSKFSIGTPGSSFYTYGYEQRSHFKVQVFVADGNFLEKVVFDNIRSIDPVADVINCGPSQTNSWDFDGDGVGETPGIGSLTVNGCHAGLRRSTRAFIASGSQTGNIVINRITSDVRNADYRYNTIETEQATVGTQKTRTVMTNLEIDAIELGGAVATANMQYQVTVLDSKIRDYLLPVRCNLVAERTEINLKIGNSWVPWDSIIRNCRIVHWTRNYGAGVQDLNFINLVPSSSGPAEILFENNEHVLAGPALAGAISRYCIAVTNMVAANIDAYNVRVFISRFPVGIYGSVTNFSGGTLHTRGNRFAGTTRGVLTGSIGTFSASWNSVDDDFRPVTGDPFFLAGNLSGTTGRVSIKGGKYPSANFGITGSFYRDMIGVCERKFQVTAVPTTGGLVGDISQLTDAAYTAAASAAQTRWMCVQSHPTAATWLGIGPTKP